MSQSLPRGFIAFQTHQALNLHFNPKSNYCFVTYNGKTRANPESFHKNVNKWQYASLESKLDTNLVLAFYLVYKQQDFVFVPPKMLFLRMKNLLYKNKDSVTIKHLEEVIRNDLKYLHSKYSQDHLQITYTELLYPNLYNEYSDENISLETLLAFDSYVTNILHKDNSDDIISWPIIVNKMDRIRPFIELFVKKDWFLDMFKTVYLEGNK